MIKYTIMIDCKKTTDNGFKRLFSKLRQKKYIPMKMKAADWTVVNETHRRAWIEIEVPESDRESWPEVFEGLIAGAAWGCRQGHEASNWAASFIQGAEY